MPAAASVRPPEIEFSQAQAGQVSAATNYNLPLATQSLRVLPLLGMGQHYQAHQERKVQVCSSILSSY